MPIQNVYHMWGNNNNKYKLLCPSGAQTCALAVRTDRHTPMTTRPCGLRRAGNKDMSKRSINRLTVTKARVVTTPEQSGTKRFSAIV